MDFGGPVGASPERRYATISNALRSVDLGSVSAAMRSSNVAIRYRLAQRQLRAPWPGGQPVRRCIVQSQRRSHATVMPQISPDLKFIRIASNSNLDGYCKQSYAFHWPTSPVPSW